MLQEAMQIHAILVLLAGKLITASTNEAVIEYLCNKKKGHRITKETCCTSFSQAIRMQSNAEISM